MYAFKMIFKIGNIVAVFLFKLEKSIYVQLFF